MEQRARRASHRAFAPLVLLLATGVAGADAPPPGPPVGGRAPVILVYGDSLTWESIFALTTGLERALPGFDAVVRAEPGAAQCDFHDWMAADGKLAPRVVVIQFSGNYHTPCVKKRERITAYEQDADHAGRLWRERGVPLLFVGSPPPVGGTPASDPIGDVYRAAAARWQSTFVDAAAPFVDPETGHFAERLPCLAHEDAARGCGADQRIRVRARDGLHFCTAAAAGPCVSYSSGVDRFSRAIVAATVRALESPPQPVPPAVSD